MMVVVDTAIHIETIAGGSNNCRTECLFLEGVSKIL